MVRAVLRLRTAETDGACFQLRVITRRRRFSNPADAAPFINLVTA